MYIAIAGNIGSGKTTLTQILTKRYNAKSYLEECNNPYIGDFYEDMNRWSFNLQMYFLGSRIQQTMDMLSDGGSGVIFQDRTVYEDAHIFAGNLHEMGLMPTRDIETYMKIFRLVTELIPKPDPILDPDLKRELSDMLSIQLSDKHKACFVDDHLRNRWKSARPQKEKVRAQYTFYEYLKSGELKVES